MPPIKKKKGYTLTEVLVVVLILGVLSAVAYPTYTKAINKSRAIEAMNLLEMVRNKQISNHARKGIYLENFTNMGQLTANAAQEKVSGGKMTVGKYELSIYAEASCMTAAYIPSAGKSPVFTFSSGYEEAGLGCEGSVCATFGNVVGGKESVCNCGNKNCGSNFNMDPVSCACSCPLDCNQNNLCYEKTQTKALTQTCGYNNSGTQARTCTASCDGGSCGGWSACTGQSCNASTKPIASQACASGCGSQTRTVTCDNGVWKTGAWSPSSCPEKTMLLSSTKTCGYNNSGTQTRSCTATCGGGECGEWGACTGQSCDSATKPSASQACASGCGTQTRTVTCNNGAWATGSWTGTCSSPTQTQPTSQSCGNGGTQTRTCTANCSGGSCGAWGTCTGEAKDCPASSKPSSSQSCGNCGSQTRSVSCNTSTGNWTTGSWGSCSGQGSCSPGASQSCGSGGTQTCSSSCSWGSCTGETKDCPASSKPSTSQSCGNCGSQTRSVSCNTSTGNWSTGSWGSCSGQGSCSPGAKQSCGNGGTQTCSSSCSWGSCTGETNPCAAYSSCPYVVNGSDVYSKCQGCGKIPGGGTVTCGGTQYMLCQTQPTTPENCSTYQKCPYVRSGPNSASDCSACGYMIPTGGTVNCGGSSYTLCKAQSCDICAATGGNACQGLPLYDRCPLKSGNCGTCRLNSCTGALKYCGTAACATDPKWC